MCSPHTGSSRRTGPVVVAESWAGSAESSYPASAPQSSGAAHAQNTTYTRRQTHKSGQKNSTLGHIKVNKSKHTHTKTALDKTMLHFLPYDPWRRQNTRRHPPHSPSHTGSGRGGHSFPGHTLETSTIPITLIIRWAWQIPLICSYQPWLPN